MNMEKLIEQITSEVMSQISNGKPEAKVSQGTASTIKPSMNANVITGAQVGRMIDHTLLKPESTEEQIIKICEEAKEFSFATVCVNSYWVPTVAKQLAGSNVGITTVVGFPLGASNTFVKVAESRDAIADGATEIDMVMNIGAMKSGDYETVKKDIEGVVLACGDIPVKVIIETGFLTTEEKKKACMLSKMAGAAFVKTSTGFGPGCATPEDIKLMREAVGPDLGVKASACVRDLDTARKMIAAGATRIGASAGVAIVKGGVGEGY